MGRKRRFCQIEQINMDTSSSVDLPDEIIELILSRCPLESVVKFKSVSKSWQSIISSSRFSRIHRIQRSKMPENQNKFFLWEEQAWGWGHRKYGLHLIRWEDEKFRTKSKSVLLGYPASSRKLFVPLCSCNGLILLRANKEYKLWNPLLRKHIIIPHPFNPKTHPKAFRNWITPKTPRIFHLYRDSITDDYKIVFHYELQCYTIYSCKNGSWGEIKHFPDLDWKECLYGIDGSCLYGMCNGNTEIISFDARDEKLLKFPLPKGVECLVKEVKLEAVFGRLCLYGFNDYLKQRLHLWVMEENGSFDKSWRKLISMEKEEPSIRPLRPVYLTNKDDVGLRAYVTKPALNFIDDFIYNPHGNCSFKVINHCYFDHELFPYYENLDMPYSSNTPPSSHFVSGESIQKMKGMFSRDRPKRKFRHGDFGKKIDG